MGVFRHTRATCRRRRETLAIVRDPIIVEDQQDESVEQTSLGVVDAAAAEDVDYAPLNGGDPVAEVEDYVSGEHHLEGNEVEDYVLGE